MTHNYRRQLPEKCSETRISGTKEWAAQNINCCTGCSHGCLYCYARSSALRFGRIKHGEDWTTERINQKAVDRSYPKYAGTVMFPSTHDITPTNLDACIIVLGKLLAADNNVLIVSKPHLKVIELLCHLFQDYKEQILFRFTIGGDSHLAFWEPNAPDFYERLRSLQLAFDSGFKTSVSCEPLLQPGIVYKLVRVLEIYTTDSIWIGAANKLKQRTAWIGPDHPGYGQLAGKIAELEQWQTAEKIREMVDILASNPKVRWKDSYRKVLALKELTI